MRERAGLVIVMVAACCFLIPAVVMAAVPERINYQGFLTDTTGAPANGAFDIRFAIYDADTGGNLLWSETLSVDVNEGVFSVVLGEGTPVDLPFDLQYYLGIKVGMDPEMTPRQPLTTSPYSFRADEAGTAGEADTVDGKHAAELDQSGHLLRTDNPHEVTAGQAGASPLGHAHDGGDITTGTVAEARIDGAVARETEVDDAVSGHAAIPDVHHARYTDGEAVAALDNASGPGSGFDADTVDGQHAGDFMAAGTDQWVDSAGDAMTGDLTVDGKVGVGVAVPARPLEVSDGSDTFAVDLTGSVVLVGEPADKDFRLTGSDGTPGSEQGTHLTLSAGGGDTSGSGGPGGDVVIIGGDSGGSGVHPGGDIILTPGSGSAGGEQGIIEARGKLGIGTPDPAAELDVVGDISVSGVVSAGEGNSDDWNAAYNWGDHSVPGYLTSESDPDFHNWDRSSGIAITENQVTDLTHFSAADEIDPQVGTINAGDWCRGGGAGSLIDCDVPPVTDNSQLANGAGYLAGVNSDATLTGGGTGGDPLGIFVPMELSATSGGAATIRGISTTNANPLNSPEREVGVRGDNTASNTWGVLGGILVGAYGEHAGSGNYGLLGAEGVGIRGEATGADDTGIYGLASHTTGQNAGVFGETKSPNGIGVSGRDGSGSGQGIGIYGESLNGTAIAARADGQGVINYGVHGESGSSIGIGVFGRADYEDDPGDGFPLDPNPDNIGVRGDANGTGVYGENIDTGNYGTLGTRNEGVMGVVPAGSGFHGVVGTNGSNSGYLAGDTMGVYGENTNGNLGALGDDGFGVYGQGAAAMSGVRGEARNGNVGDLGSDLAGVWGRSGVGGWAGYFDGDVNVVNDLSVGGAIEAGSINADSHNHDHDLLINHHNLSTDIDHDQLTNTHNLATDIDHDQLTNTHNLTTDIDHGQLANTHNLSTDIDHDQLTGFVFDEHIDWTQAGQGIIDPSNYTDKDTLAGLSGCGTGQVAKYTLGTGWSCADDQDTTTFWSLNGDGGTTPGTDFLGTTDNVSFEIKVDGSRALRVEPTGGTPNLIGGRSFNSADGGVMGATVAGGGGDGGGNLVFDHYGTISGGENNAAGDQSDVDPAVQVYATVGGGSNNQALGSHATVGGGDLNQADAGATVGGGIGNLALGLDSIVGGGSGNTASGERSSIGGGEANSAGAYCTDLSITSEEDCLMAAETWVTGYCSDPLSYTTETDCVAAGQTWFSASHYTTVGGGDMNIAVGEESTVAGGTGNIAGVGCSDPQWLTRASCLSNEHVWNGPNAGATVGGGWRNLALGQKSTVAGGADNSALGSFTAVGGGYENFASGYAATVPGGWMNVAQGAYSFAAGRNAVADHQGSFVWADNSGGLFSSTADYQFRVRALGGAYFSNNLEAGGVISGDGSGLTNLSADTAGDADTLDSLDSTAFVRNDELVSSSTGSADAGKPVKLNTSGEVDGSMINDSGIDHGGLANTHNLTTDIDHGQLTNTHNLSTDIDHDQLTGFVLDEHIDWTQAGQGTIDPSNYTDKDTLAGLSGCGTGQVAKYTLGTGWSCADDQDTTGFWALGGNGGTTPGTDFLGTTDASALELHVNAGRVLRLEPTAGSPNFIGGYLGNLVAAGATGATINGGGAAGSENLVTDDYGSIGGGLNNVAGDGNGVPHDQPYATVGGGQSNGASAQYATVGGGRANSATTIYATVGGGDGNQAGNTATVGGGSSNIASGQYSVVAGGIQNSATQIRATVGGGVLNTASGLNSTIGGGSDNSAAGVNATVPGGSNNSAGGDYSLAAGRWARTSHQGAFVWADSTTAGTYYSSDAADQFKVRATGGADFDAAMSVTKEDPNNNSVTDVLTLTHSTSNAANGADGMGTGLVFQAEDDSNETEPVGGVIATLDVSANASETSSLRFYTRDGVSSIMNEVMTLDGDGNLSLAGGLLNQYGNVAVVAESGGDYPDPVTAMGDVGNAGGWCPNPTSTSPCLLKIMPGFYDLSGVSLDMIGFVDIEGSGENVTTLFSDTLPNMSPVVAGADNAELRQLTVWNASTAFNNYGIFNGGNSPAITNVTVLVDGTSGANIAIRNETGAAPVITDTTVTCVAPGGTQACAGINSADSSPVLDSVTVKVTGDGSATSGGVRDINGHTTIRNSTITAAGSGVNYAVYHSATGSPDKIMRIENSVLDGVSGDLMHGTNVYGVTRIANSRIENGTVNQSTGSITCFNVYDGNFGTPTCP